MKHLAFLVIAGVWLISGCTHSPRSTGSTAVKIIFDTDLGPDYDDVGALAFLHAMADSGKIELLATLASNKQELVAPSIEVINTYFGRGSLPIGAPKTDGVSMGSSQHWADSIVAHYPHKLQSTNDADDAVQVYRKVLAGQPDHSVTLVTVGFLTNLKNLLQSGPDGYSSLSGIDLVKAKVWKLVSMAGGFPSGKEFNVFCDLASSEYVYTHWPSEIIFSGFEIGRDIKAGLRLMQSGITNSPVKDVFSISIPQSEEDRGGRMSWDETAALIGVYGTEGFFDTVKGTIIIHRDSTNGWEDNPQGRHTYVRQKMPVDQMSRFIEDRMMHQPVK